MKNKNFVVGLFAISGVVLFTLGIVLIGNRHQVFTRNVEFYTEFTDLAGLSKGAKVRVGGMDAGEVEEIEVPASPTSRFRVKFRVDEKLDGLVRTDSVASIAVQGVVGDMLMSIQPGKPQAQAAAPLSTLPSKEPLELADLLEKGKGVLDDAHTTLHDADTELNTLGPKLDQTLDGAATSITHLNDVLYLTTNGHGPMSMILQDEKLAAQIRRISTNAEGLTVQLSETLSKADSLVSDLQSRQLPAKAEQAMTSIQNTAANLDTTSQQVKQTVAEFTAPDAHGVDAGVNVRESLGNVNIATGNMADDSEALKHNFLLRGFFKKRGYYELNNIPPGAYRKDRAFTKSSNNRVWLSTSEIFQTTADGHELLTPSGKSKIDSVFLQFGEKAFESPIVIEGYDSAPDAVDQFLHSRSRATLVRQYLQSRFALASNALGSVSLGASPPAATGRATWDGICILLLPPPTR